MAKKKKRKPTKEELEWFKQMDLRVQIESRTIGEYENERDSCSAAIEFNRSLIKLQIDNRKAYAAQIVMGRKTLRETHSILRRYKKKEGLA